MTSTNLPDAPPPTPRHFKLTIECSVPAETDAEAASKVVGIGRVLDDCPYIEEWFLTAIAFSSV